MKMLKVICFICWTIYSGIMFYTYFFGDKTLPTWNQVLIMCCSLVFFSFGEIMEELFKKERK